MPALSKNPEDKAGHHAAPGILAPIQGNLPAPRPPSGLSLKLRKQWADFWRSPVARILDPAVDGPVIVRLFELYALGEQVAGMLARDARAERRARLMLTEARGDPEAVMTALAEAEMVRKSYNATVGARVRVATEVRMLESQLGISPRSRLALGVMLVAGRKALATAMDDEDDDDY